MACSFESRCQADVLFVVCYNTLQVNFNLNLDFPAEEVSGCDWCRHVHRRISILCVFIFFKKVRESDLYGLKPGHTILLLAKMDADDIVEAAFIL